MPHRKLDSAAFAELATSVLAGGHILRFHATGNSMRPFIWDGDELEIKAVNPLNLRRGDIILCRLASGRLVAHRVMRVSQTALFVQGDALLVPDGDIPLHNVMGQVCAVTHKARRRATDTALLHTLASVWMVLLPVREPMLACIRLGLRLLKRWNKGKTS